MIVYKLTDAQGQSYGGTQWGPNVTHTATGKGKKFCSPDLIHLYSHPLLAVLLSPVHVHFGPGMKLWEATTGGKVLSDHGLKLGAKTVTTVREIPLPVVTRTQRVRFAILCALEVLPDRPWAAIYRRWAERWLNGSDRTAKAAQAVVEVGGVQMTAAWLTIDAVRITILCAGEVGEEGVAWAVEEAVRVSPLDLVALAQRAIQEE